MKKRRASEGGGRVKEEAHAHYGSTLRGGTSNVERRTLNVELKKEGAKTGGVRFDLEERLLDYAVRIIRLVDASPATKAGRHVADQLLRCGTSPLANHGELQGAESRRDFIHKLGICLKEIREAQRWLRLIHRVPLLALAKINPLLTETDPLIRIFVRSVRTAEKNR